MSDREAIESELARAGAAPEAAFPLLDAALLLGALDAPETDLSRPRARVAALVERLRAVEAGTADAQAAALSRALHEEAGFDGDRDSYDHPDNANLIHVIQRRRGLPVALGVLYLHVGEALGWRLRGLDMPGHFVLRLDTGEEHRLIDPFNGGAVIEMTELREIVKQAAGPRAQMPHQSEAAMTKRGVLLRLQNNIKIRALAAHQLDRAAEILRRMSLVAPEAAAVWFERGVLEEKMDHLTAASHAFVACRERADSQRLRDQAEQALSRLRQRLN